MLDTFRICLLQVLEAIRYVVFSVIGLIAKAASYSRMLPRRLKIWYLRRELNAELVKDRYLADKFVVYNNTIISLCPNCNEMHRILQSEFSRTFLCSHCGKTVDMNRWFL